METRRTGVRATCVSCGRVWPYLKRQWHYGRLETYASDGTKVYLLEPRHIGQDKPKRRNVPLTEPWF